MATTTTNLGLTKPATSDNVDITVINGNMDIIDASISALQRGLAIECNGNTHAAISAGQFAYVRNHSTLTEGLYVANAAISQNATLSSTNLTSVSGGGLNMLLGKIDSSKSVSEYVNTNNLTDFESAITNLCSNLAEGEFHFIEVYCNWSGSFTGGAKSLAIIYRPRSIPQYDCYILLGGANGLYHSNSWHWQKPTQVTFERKTRTYTGVTIPSAGYIKVDSYGDMNVSTSNYLLSITIRGWSGNIAEITLAKGSNGTDIYMIGPANMTVSSITVEYVFSNA